MPRSIQGKPRARRLDPILETWKGSVMEEFRGKTAFVTGGASGMGLAMAEAFGREGMNVMLAARAQPLLERLRDEVRAVVEAGGAVPRRR